MKACLNRNQLKIIALISMIIDHIGLYFFPNILIFRILGRLAFPIFAFFISEGYFHTHSKLRYFLILFVFAIISQIPFGLVNNNFTFFNILFAFLLSIVLIYLIEQIKDKERKNPLFISILELIVLSVALIILNRFIDYGVFGVLTPVVFYFFRDKNLIKYVLFSVLMVGFAVWRVINYSFAFSNFIQLFSLLAIILLLLYNNEKGKRNLKYLLYFFYPVHLIFIYLITLIV